MNDFIKRLTIAHDVYCPTCGTKADFEITGHHKFNTVSCAHDELEKLVMQRLDDLMSDKFTGH